MNIKKPRDYRLMNQFVRLKKILGSEVKAMIAFECLWVQLGYQLEVHGVSGFFQESEAESFLESMPMPIENVVPSLVSAGILTQRKGGYECPMFTHCNPELDANYIKQANGSHFIIFNKGKILIEKEAPVTATKLSADAWHDINGKRIDGQKMNKAIVVIKTLDSILKLGKRHPEEFTAGLIHGAIRVIDEYDDMKLNLILRRMYVLRSKRFMPRSSGRILESFSDIVAQIMPSEGFVKWAKTDYGNTLSQPN